MARGVVVFAFACLAVRAQDAPPPKPFADARAAYEEADQTGDAARLPAALADLARSGYLSEDSGEKAFARSALRKALRHKDPAVQLAAAKGYGVLRDPGSSRDLKPLLRPGRLPQKALLAAIQSHGDLHDPGTHDDLLALAKDITDDADTRDAARAAAAAVANWRALEPRQRVRVIDDLMKVYARLWGLAFKRSDDDSPGVRWWNVVSPGLLEAFNALTGQHCEEYHGCKLWWEENRSAFAKR